MTLDDGVEISKTDLTKNEGIEYIQNSFCTFQLCRSTGERIEIERAYKKLLSREAEMKMEIKIIIAIGG